MPITNRTPFVIPPGGLDSEMDELPCKHKNADYK